MWIRKSDQEIQTYVDREKAERKSWLRPLVSASILTVGSMALYYLGYRGGWQRGGVILVSPGPSVLSFQTIFGGAFLFVFFSIILFNRQRSRPLLSYSANDQLLCRECKQPANGNALGVCNCGGRLEPFGFFSWVEKSEN